MLYKKRPGVSQTAAECGIRSAESKNGTDRLIEEPGQPDSCDFTRTPRIACMFPKCAFVFSVVAERLRESLDSNKASSADFHS